jgi:hypothetical protein
MAVISRVTGDFYHPCPHRSFWLFKVNSDAMRYKISEILSAVRPTHSERLWLVGFLKYVGYTEREVCNIIHTYAQWIRYDQQITAYQVAFVFKSRYHKSATPTLSPRRRKWNLRPVEVWRINCARTSEMNRRITTELQRLGLPIFESPHSRVLPFRPETLLRRGL